MQDGVQFRFACNMPFMNGILLVIAAADVFVGAVDVLPLVGASARSTPPAGIVDWVTLAATCSSRDSLVNTGTWTTWPGYDGPADLQAYLFGINFSEQFSAPRITSVGSARRSRQSPAPVWSLRAAIGPNAVLPLGSILRTTGVFRVSSQASVTSSSSSQSASDNGNSPMTGGGISGGVATSSSGSVSEPSTASAQFVDWLQDNWWVPLLITYLALSGLLALWLLYVRPRYAARRAQRKLLRKLAEMEAKAVSVSLSLFDISLHLSPPVSALSSRFPPCSLTSTSRPLSAHQIHRRNPLRESLELLRVPKSQSPNVGRRLVIVAFLSLSLPLSLPHPLWLSVCRFATFNFRLPLQSGHVSLHLCLTHFLSLASTSESVSFSLPCSLALSLFVPCMCFNHFFRRSLVRIRGSEVSSLLPLSLFQRRGHTVSSFFFYEATHSVPILPQQSALTYPPLPMSRQRLGGSEATTTDAFTSTVTSTTTSPASAARQVTTPSSLSKRYQARLRLIATAISPATGGESGPPTPSSSSPSWRPRLARFADPPVQPQPPPAAASAAATTPPPPLSAQLEEQDTRAGGLRSASVNSDGDSGSDSSYSTASGTPVSLCHGENSSLSMSPDASRVISAPGALRSAVTAHYATGARVQEPLCGQSPCGRRHWCWHRRW